MKTNGRNISKAAATGTLGALAVAAMIGAVFSTVRASTESAQDGYAAGREVAKVNGQSLTDRDIRLALASVNEGMRANILSDPNNRRQILVSLIDQQVLVDEATKEKLDQDQDFKDAMALFRKQYLSSRALQKNLAPKITEAAAKRFYDQNRSRYSTDQVHAMHILVSDEEKAKEVLKLAQVPGTDFQDLAEKYSHDPSAKNNRGDLGAFGRNAPFDPAFLDAAFGANAGEVVGPVKTAVGYHIIRVVEKKFGPTMSFDDVRHQVENDMTQDLRTSYVGKLKKQARIEVDNAALDKI